MKTKLPFLAILLSFLCFTGCSDDENVFYDGEIVGKWQLIECEITGFEGREQITDGTIVEFLPDGRYSWQYPDYEEIFYAQYRLDGNTLYKEIEEVKYVYDYKFKGNTLILELISTEGLFCGTEIMNYGVYKKLNE